MTELKIIVAPKSSYNHTEKVIREKTSDCNRNDRDDDNNPLDPISLEPIESKYRISVQSSNSLNILCFDARILFQYWQNQSKKRSLPDHYASNPINRGYFDKKSVEYVRDFLIRKEEELTESEEEEEELTESEEEEELTESEEEEEEEGLLESEEDQEAYRRLIEERDARPDLFYLPPELEEMFTEAIKLYNAVEEDLSEKFLFGFDPNNMTREEKDHVLDLIGDESLKNEYYDLIFQISVNATLDKITAQVGEDDDFEDIELYRPVQDVVELVKYLREINQRLWNVFGDFIPLINMFL